MDIQQVINSSFSLRLVSALARLLPPRLGHYVADLAAEQIASRRDSKIVRAVRSNQWVIRGETLDKEALDQAVCETFLHWARSIFDLYHYIQDPEATKQLVVLDERAQLLTRRPEFDNRGLLIVGLHLSNFDLILQWLCRQMVSPLVLTIPNPQGGRRLEYEIRKRVGMNLIPVSIDSIRQALKHLKQGGVVLTGIDRPIPEPGSRPRFFGRPAALPLHHIFLAIKAQVPVIIAVNHLEPDGKYHVLTSDLIEMDHHPNHELETLENGEKVLGMAEEFIRRAPQQWSVPLPVWPEIMDLVPR
jgi:KDO2-lipid IV(A) lauroyltransferase